MARSKLLPASETVLVDPFSKKGALALFWLLARRSVDRQGGETFSVNQAAREIGVRPFTVHRVIRTLEYDGIIRAEGSGTKKRFRLAEPKRLLVRWLRGYQIQRKARLRKFTLSDPRAFADMRAGFLDQVAIPALHTAAQQVFRAGVTNLSTTEAYLNEKVSPESLSRLKSKFGLVEQERGYEVLLIEPYYKELVKRFAKERSDPLWRSAFGILTFLELYHFPVRGREQAEALYRRLPALKSMGPWSDFEAVEAL